MVVVRHRKTNSARTASNRLAGEKNNALPPFAEGKSRSHSVVSSRRTCNLFQVLLSQVHRLRALDLLGRFLDLGPWAVSLVCLDSSCFCLHVHECEVCWRKYSRSKSWRFFVAVKHAFDVSGLVCGYLPVCFETSSKYRARIEATSSIYLGQNPRS